LRACPPLSYVRPLLCVLNIAFLVVRGAGSSSPQLFLICPCATCALAGRFSFFPTMSLSRRTHLSFRRHLFFMDAQLVSWIVVDFLFFFFLFCFFFFFFFVLFFFLDFPPFLSRDPSLLKPVSGGAGFLCACFFFLFFPPTMKVHSRSLFLSPPPVATKQFGVLLFLLLMLETLHAPWALGRLFISMAKRNYALFP